MSKIGKLKENIEISSEVAMYRYTWRKCIDIKTLEQIIDKMFAEFPLFTRPNLPEGIVQFTVTDYKDFLNSLLDWKEKWYDK